MIIFATLYHQNDNCNTNFGMLKTTDFEIRELISMVPFLLPQLTTCEKNFENDCDGDHEHKEKVLQFLCDQMSTH